jgi:hypothetical protein
MMLDLDKRPGIKAIKNPERILQLFPGIDSRKINYA